jgi:hydrogenase expression/formation protein HypC
MEVTINMCLAVPAKITVLDQDIAKVDILGVESVVNIQLIESPMIGDYVLVHAGCAIEKIHAEYFEYLRENLEEMLKVEQNE